MVDTKAINNPTATSTHIDLPPNWHPTDKFTGDEMIDAYFLGREAGVKAGWDEKFKIITNQFKKNIDKAVELSEQLHKEILEKVNVSLKSIHLKSDGLTKFTALFIANTSDYISDDFLQVHNVARLYNAHKKSDDVYMSFLFMAESPNMSEDCLNADGYFLRYDKSK